MKSSRLSYAALCAAVIFLPAAITLLLVRFHLNASLTDTVPTYFGPYNDAFYYWRQVATFASAGMNGGYYTLSEYPAPARFSHFYVHGPAFPMIYGTISRLTGWEYYSGPVVNLILVTLAAAFFVYRVKPPPRRLAVLGIVLATFWPLLLYLPMTMQESLHHAFAFVLAAAFYGLLSPERPPTRAQAAGFAALIFVAALVRVTWAVLFFPLFVLAARRGSMRRITMGLAVAVALFALAYAATSYLAADYLFSFAKMLREAFAVSVQAGLEMLRNHVRLVLDNFNKGSALEVIQQYEVIALIGVCGVGAVLRTVVGEWITRIYDAMRQTIRGRLGTQYAGSLHMQPTDDPPIARPSFLSRHEIVFHLFNLSVLVIVVLFYEFFEWRGYRTLAPHLLLALLVLIACGRLRLALAVAVSSALVIGGFLDAYRQNGEGLLNADRQAIAAFGELTHDLIVYDANASSAWCNTLLFKMTDRNGRVAVFPPELLAIDPRIGVSFFVESYQTRDPVRSKYLLMDAPTRSAFVNTQADLIAETPIGNLYVNRRAQC